MTTNIGSDLIRDRFNEITDENDLLAASELAKIEVMERLKASVRPEFLNRIDEVIMFKPLNREDIRKIVSIQVDLVIERLNENGVQLSVTQAALDYLGREGFDPQFGARPLKRVIQRQLLNELSKQILAGKIHQESKVQVEMNEDGQLTFVTLTEPETV